MLTEGDLTEQQDAYEILYPAYGTYVGNAFGNVVSGPVVYLASVVTGHIMGRMKSEELRQGTLPEALNAQRAKAQSEETARKEATPTTPVASADRREE